MHKLLERQINRYLKMSEVSSDLKAFLSAVNEAYEQNDESYVMLEHSLDFTSKELLARNKDLSRTLEELKEAQSQLVQSAKMVALGQLIAGIAHEINTPAAAIVSAIGEIKQDYHIILQELLDIVSELTPEQIQIYLKTVGKVITLDKNASTVEQRQKAKQIEAKLAEQNLPHVRQVSKDLTNIGFTLKDLDALLPLLKTPSYQLIVQSLFDYGMSQIHVDDIVIAIGRIIQIVKALKIYARSDQQTYTYTNLKEDLENTLVILNNKLKRAINLKKEYEDIPEVRCYPDQLNQVWTNLINNSIEAMHGQGNIIIRLKKINDKQISVEVEDDGPGISEAVLPKIFDPYFTTKPKGEGTGLGLSISRDIVRRQNGDILVETKPGQTIFKVVLPINVPEYSAVAEGR